MSDIDNGPVPLMATAARNFRIAVVVTRFPGVPVVARYLHRQRQWECLWGIFKGRLLRADKSDEGRWMEIGDVFGPLPDGTEVVAGEFDIAIRPATDAKADADV